MSWKRVFLQFQQLSINIHYSFNSAVLNNSKMSYYAVARGRTVGIYISWADCESQVKGFSGAKYKKFDSIASAESFIKNEGSGSTSRAYTQSNYARTNNNLKRPYSTASTSHKNYNSKNYQSSNSEDSDSDDLNAMITKQLDAIEKKVHRFGKGIDKIEKKYGKGPEKKAIMIEPPQPKKRRSSSSFDKDDDGYVQVYTDGACSANGRKGARAGLGVYWGDGHCLNTSEPVIGRATNNCGEIQAATWAIKQAVQNGVTKLAINTDSQFLINSVTKWMPGWKRKGWKLQSGEPVKNKTDFMELDALQHKLQVKWNYVEAHRGIHGNEMADQLAKDGASKYTIK